MPPKAVCRFYATPGGCTKGSRCRFAHGPSPAGGIPKPEDRAAMPCHFFLRGNCKRGDSCHFLHDSSAVPQPSSSTAGPRSGPSTSQSGAEQGDAEDAVCAICYDKPREYGLLINCDHIFCLTCVREWRKTQNKTEDLRDSQVIKDCPICRNKSDFIVPSFSFVKGANKDRLIKSYKDRLASIPCRYFTRTGRLAQTCPFKEDCFYAHNDANGKPIPCKPMPPPRRRRNYFVDDGPIFLPFAMSAREMRLIDEFYDHGFSDDELYGDDEEFFEDDDDFYTDDDDYTDDDFDDEDEDEDDDEEVELTAEQQAAIRQRCAQQ